MYTGQLYFLFAKLQEQATTSTFLSIGLSLVVAVFFTSIATNNFIIGLMVLVPLTGTVVCVLGSVYLFDWPLGVLEAANVIILVGIAVDYVIHLGVAYNEVEAVSRKEKVRHALVTLGTSVIFGAATTFFAARFLLLGTITFFSKFGSLFVLTIFFALVWGLILFPALLMQFDPEGNTGRVRQLKEKVEKTHDRRSAETLNKYFVGMFLGLVLFMIICTIIFVVQRNQEGDDDDDALVENPNQFSLFEDQEVEFSSLRESIWTEIETAVDTSCSRGTPYSFFVRKGSHSTSVMVEFEGGGACWSEQTCQSATGTFKESVQPNREFFMEVNEGTDTAFGIKDMSGPYANFTHVFVPYCSGDLHWGNNSVQYTEDLFIRHHGAENAKMALDWTLRQLPVPERMLVTGCSAGAYASWLWTTYLAKSLPNTRIFQMADSGMGVITDDFLADSFPSWKVNETTVFPWEIFADNTTTDGLSMADLYTVAAQFFVNTTFGQVTSAYDWNQAFFYKGQTNEETASTRDLFLEDKINWRNNFTSIYEELAQESPPNLYHLIIPGDFHCSIVSNRYFAVPDGNGDKLYRTIHGFWQQDLFPQSNFESCNETCTIGVDWRDEIRLL